LIALRTRPLDANEHDLVLVDWTRSLADNTPGPGLPPAGRFIRLPTDRGSSTAYVRVGGEARLSAWCWHAMHRSYVRELLGTIKVDVATLPDHSEPLGWVAYAPASKEHPIVVHYLHVITQARRRGVGEHLLRHALEQQDSRGVRISHLTAVGRRLLDRIAGPVLRASMARRIEDLAPP
jgi:ribosomal protein S18 acetylase RimI-like enzyme